MATYLPLPNGAYYPVADGQDPKDAWQRAMQKYPEAFTPKPPEPPKPEAEGGFFPALKAGYSALKSDVAGLAGRSGLMDLAEAEKYIAGEKKYQAETFKPTTESFADAPLTNIKELLGGSLPYMAAPIVAGGAAAAAAPASAVAGIGAAGLASLAQFTGSNLTRQVEDGGKTLGETDITNAALAAIPQTALDIISLRMIPGLGKILEGAGVKLAKEEVKNFAEEALKKTATDYALKTGRTMGVEGLTEASQQIFERAQAGLNITDPEARQEYFDSFIGGAVLGGVIAPAGRYIERGQAQTRYDIGEAVKQQIAQQEQLKLDALALAEEERKKSSPEYFQTLSAEYKAAEQAKNDLKAQLRKVVAGSETETADRLHNTEITAQIKEMSPGVQALAAEYNRLQKVQPKADETAPEKEQVSLAVGDTLDNPLGNFTKEELASRAPTVAKYIDDARKKAGKPALETYSIEDIRNAMPNQLPEAEQADLSSLIAAKTGHTGDITYKPTDVIEVAKQKNIDTTTDGFKDFLRRATGDAELEQLTQPQLHSAFKALSSLPRFEETQILPQKRNATDYSKEQYGKAVAGLQKLVEDRKLGGTEVVKEGEKPIVKPVSIAEANAVIKAQTGLKNDADVQTLFRDANRNGDIDFKGDEVTYQPKGAQAEFNIEEGFAPAEGTGFNVMRNGEMLFATNDEAEANAKAEKLGKNAAPAIQQIDKSIAKENSTVADSQKALDAMEAEGKFNTPQYTQAAARHAGVVDKANKTIESLNTKKQMLQKPVTVQKAGKPTNRKTFTVKEKGVAEKSFNTREEAEKHALENLPEERLNKLSTQTKAPGFANRLKKEQERRKKPVLALPAPKPKGPSAEATALQSKLLPMLRKFGLGDVALKIEEAMVDEGSYGANVITVALDADNPIRVLRHETIHGLKDLGFFTPGQWKILENQADKVWIDKYLKQRNRGGGPLKAGEQSRHKAYEELYNKDINKIREEAISDAFADFDVNGAPKGLFAQLLNAMRKFFRNLRAALNGAGYETAEDIFGKVERGELKATKAAEEEAEEKPSMRTTAKGLLNPKIRPKYEKIINDVVEEMGLTPEEFASTSLIHQTGKAGVDQFEADKLGGLPEVVQFLQDQRRNSGLPLLDVEKPADRKMIAKLMATEAMAAIRSGGANLEWYDSIINKTLAMAGLKYPELITDINARTAFRIATAITSQGLNVEDNLGFAMKVYDQFRQNKKFPEVGQGADQGAMVNNFKLANYLMNDMGANTLRQFLETEFTVEEMRGAGFNIAGELGDEVVLGSSVFGPKIGFGFYSNLNGNFDPVTMDMWFMRTIGRLTGKLKSFRQDLYDAQLGKFRDGLDVEGSNGVFANQFNQDEIDLAKADDKAAEALARKVKSAHERDYKVNRAGYDDGTREKSKLVAAAETMIKSLDAPKDAPANGSERRNLRDVVRQMVDIVEEKYGKRVPPASLQAVIWYPEQELYKAMGVKLRVTSQNYAGAIEKILKGEGYGESDLSAAAKLRPRTPQQLAKSTVASGTQATGTEPIRLGALQAGEKEALLERGRKRVVLEEEKETPKRKKLIFEVAPDPNNKALAAKWRALPNQARIKISEKIGNIIIKNALNTFGLKGYVDTQIGSYLDDTNPSFALYLDSGDAVAMTKFLGHALSQDSMMVLSPKPAKGLDKTGAVRINIGNMSSSDVDNIYQQLREIEVDGEKPVGGQSYMNGHMLVLNYSNVPTDQLASLINEKLDNSYPVITEDVYTAFPEKKDYDYASPSSDPRGNAGVLRQASRNLRAEATRLLQKELREFKSEKAPATTGGTKASLRTAPNTAEFKQWFGDSKIVDANGNPRVMYHGTARDISEFKPQQAGAIFITDNPDTAARYSSESIQWVAEHAPEFLSPKQMMDSVKTAKSLLKKNGYTDKQIAALQQDKGFYKTDEFREAASKYLGSGENILPLYVRAENIFDYDNPDHVKAVMDKVKGLKAESFDRTNNWTTIEAPEVQKAIKELGFDSFYVAEHGDKNLAVYDPAQIKSATGNEGTYDINNPDIRKSLRSAAGMFDQDELNKNAVTRYKSREKVVEMDIDDFLNLSDYTNSETDSNSREKMANARKRVADGTKFTTLPYMSIKGYSGTLKVTGHEGRHRAKALKEVGYKTMPVLLDSNIRWSEQNDPEKFDYQEDWPTRIEAQYEAINPNFSIPFPFTREESGMDYEQPTQARASLRTAPNTPEFKRFFRDSKVVDESGKPLVVYHTGRFDADEIISGAELNRRTGKNMFAGVNLGNEGIYFTANPKYSAAYGKDKEGATMYPVYLSLQNPFVIKDKQQMNKLEKLKHFVFGKREILKNPSSDSDPRLDSMYITPEYKAELTKAGYDGIINEVHNEIVAFESTQIKSAIGNQGTYDSTNPDIRYSLRGKEKIGINVNQDGSNKYADKIVDGEKTFETRDTDSLRPYVGQRVAIVKTGEGKAKAIGAVTIGEPILVTSRKDFNKYRNQTLIPEGSRFDIADDGVKYMYPMDNPERYKKEIDVGLGIVSRKVIQERASLRTNVKNDLSNMPNGAAILATMNRVTPPREKKGFAERVINALAPEASSYFRQNFLDRYNRLNDYDRMVAQQMGGIELLADQSSHWAALNSDMAAGVTASALGVGDRMGGAPVLKNGYVTVDNFNGTVKGVLEILSPLASRGDPDIYRAYQIWSAAKRGTRLYREGRFELLTPAEIKDALTLEQKYPEFVTVQQDWIKYNNALVKMQVDGGVITKEAGVEFMKYSDYIPLYRQMDGRTTLGPSVYQSISGVKPPKTLKGKGDAPIEDYLETIVRNTQAAIQSTMKNVAAQKAVKNGMMLGMVTKLPAVSSAPDTITILENGKKVSYQCADKLFIEAVSSLNLPELPFLSILSAPADLLRSLVTKDPGFMLANMMRDSLSAYVTSGANIKPVISTVQNVGAAMMNRSPIYQALLNSGAIGGYEYSRNVEAGADAFAADLRRKTGTETGSEKLFKPFTKVWGFLERGTEISDAATRMAVYEATLKETGNEAEAIRRAVEVLNFNRKGRSAIVRIAAAAIPFLNARVQGLDVFFRAGIRPFYDKNSTAYEKQVQKAMLIRGATMMALSTMYAAAIMGDPDYEKQEQETKDNNWLIPSLGIKIPIPFEVGVLFKTIPERIYRYSYGSDTSKDLGDAMKRALLSTFAFNPVPQAIAPLLEAQYNYSVFTQRPIVGEAMRNIAPEFQVGPSTTKIAEYLGKQTGMSPIMLDHVYKGYTGTMGMYLADVMDSVFSAGSDNPKASQRFEQTPVLKRFLLDPDARGQVSAYYDLKNSVDETVRTVNLLSKQGSPDLEGYIEKNISMYGMKGYVSSVDKQMQKLSAQAAMIRSTPMPADEKRKMLDEVTRLQNDLTNEIQLIRKMARP